VEKPNGGKKEVPVANAYTMFPASGGLKVLSFFPSSKCSERPGRCCEKRRGTQKGLMTTVTRLVFRRVFRGRGTTEKGEKELKDLGQGGKEEGRGRLGGGVGKKFSLEERSKVYVEIEKKKTLDERRINLLGTPKANLKKGQRGSLKPLTQLER